MQGDTSNVALQHGSQPKHGSLRKNTAILLNEPSAQLLRDDSFSIGELKSQAEASTALEEKPLPWNRVSMA